MAQFCANCGTENADDAGFCQKCGNSLAAPEAGAQAPSEAPVQPSEKKRGLPTLVKVGGIGCASLIGLVVVIIVIGVIASSGGSKKSTSKPGVVPKPTTAPVISKPTAAPPPKANGAYTDTNTGMTVSIKQREINTQGSEFSHPANGNEYLVLSIQIHNGGTSNHDLNPLDFHAVDAAGRSYSMDALLPSKYSPALSYGTIRPGDTRLGWTGTELPISTKQVTINWDDASILSPPADVAKYTIR